MTDQYTQYPKFFLYRVTIAIALWIELLGLSSVQACTLTGCEPGKCYLSGSDMKCTTCSAGYYKSTTLEICNSCNSRCTTCTYFDNCQSCKDGYYLDTSQNFCGSCPSKCTKCVSSTECTECESGTQLSSSKTCVDSAAQSESSSSSKSSIVGQVIGYCVSGVVLILCCAITLLHQKRKQEEEERTRKQFKEEQAKLQGGGMLAGPGNDDVVVFEDAEFNKSKAVGEEIVPFSNLKLGHKQIAPPISSTTRLASEGIQPKKPAVFQSTTANSPGHQSIQTSSNNRKESGMNLDQMINPLAPTSQFVKLLKREKTTIQDAATKDAVKDIGSKEIKDNSSPVALKNDSGIGLIHTHNNATVGVFSRAKKSAV